MCLAKAAKVKHHRRGSLGVFLFPLSFRGSKGKARSPDSPRVRKCSPQTSAQHWKASKRMFLRGAFGRRVEDASPCLASRFPQARLEEDRGRQGALSLMRHRRTALPAVKRALSADGPAAAYGHPCVGRAGRSCERSGLPCGRLREAAGLRGAGAPRSGARDRIPRQPACTLQ